MPDEERVRVDVRDAAKNSEYEIVLLDEASGDRKKVGSFRTDVKGSASGEFSAKDLLKSHNALLVMDGEDVVQYAQLQEDASWVHLQAQRRDHRHAETGSGVF